MSAGIKADEESSITFSLDSGVQALGFIGCTPTITFRPEKNRLYEISPNYESKQYSIELVEVLDLELKEVE